MRLDRQEQNLLIIFARNLKLGMVKTRLAKSIGDEKALEIYTYLLNHTQKLSMGIQADRAVFFSDYIEKTQAFDAPHNIQKVQASTSDLGERMYQAMAWGLEQGYQNVVLIGSDCYELSQADLQEAFVALESHEFVIGPAADGGYYLIGTSHLNKAVFEHKEWGSPRVFEATIRDFDAYQCSYHLLAKRKDIDFLEDLPQTLVQYFGL